jgi:hypothetical protein
MSFTSFLMDHSQVLINERQRSLHTHVVGLSGMGKSKALETWITQDILAGRGVGVIDPHGDLYANLVIWLSQQPELWRKVILIDPADPEWTIGFNPLEASDQASSERLALFLTDVCVKLWKLDIGNTPRLVWLLTNSFLALSNLKLSFLDLPRFLADRPFRTEKLEHVSIPAVRRFFDHEFPQSDKAVQQWISPVLNKLGSLLFDPDISLMLQGPRTFNFRTAIDEEMVVLINLPKGILSEGLSSLVAAFFVAHIQKATLARADTAHRPPFYLYLDEFQNYTTGNITDILAESRKYNLSLTLAHQYLAQLPAEIRDSVINTAGNLVCFRVGYEDARVLAKTIFLSPNKPLKAEARLYRQQRGVLALPHLGERTWEDFTRELASLPERHFWYRRRGSYQPVKQISFWFPVGDRTSIIREATQDLRDFCGSHYGLRKSELKSRSRVYDKDFDLPFWAD